MEVYEKSEYRNKQALFEYRSAAGSELGEFLAPKYAQSDEAMVLAIPAGGVPVGLELKRRLEVPFDVCIVRKIQNPWNRESGFGAVNLDGEVLLNEPMKRAMGVTEKVEREEIERVKEELQERNRFFRGDREAADVRGRTVILTDDGLASGYTMMAAAMSVGRRGAARVVAAVPTAPRDAVEMLEKHVDEVYSLHIEYGRGPFAVARAYRNWRDLSREEVAEMLEHPGE